MKAYSLLVLLILLTAGCVPGETEEPASGAQKPGEVTLGRQQHGGPANKQGHDTTPDSQTQVPQISSESRRKVSELVDQYGGRVVTFDKGPYRGEIRAVELTFSRQNSHMHSRLLEVATGSITHRLMQLLQGARNIESLYLQGTGLRDSTLPLIASMKSLKVLFLDNNPFSSKGAKLLSGNTSLTFLSLAGARIDDNAIAGFHTLKKLDGLVLSDTLAGDRGLGAIATLKNLRLLDVSRTKVTDKGLPAIASCKQLKTLMLSGNDVSTKGFLPLLENKALQTVFAEHTQINSFHFDTKKNQMLGPLLPGLRTNPSSRIDTTKEGKQAIEQLVARGGRLFFRTRDGLLRRNPSDVYKINLRGTDAGDDDIRVIQALPNVESLLLADTRITGGAAHYISNLKKLKTLEFNRTHFHYAGFLELTSVRRKLDYLGIANTAVTAEQISGMLISNKHTGRKLEIAGLNATRERERSEAFLKAKGARIVYHTPPSNRRFGGLVVDEERARYERLKNDYKPGLPISIQFAGVKVDNDVIWHLHHFWSVERLDFDGAELSGETVSYLAACIESDNEEQWHIGRIREVALGDTKVGPAEITRLRACLPSARITHDSQAVRVSQPAAGKPQKSVSGFRFSRPLRGIGR